MKNVVQAANNLIYALSGRVLTNKMAENVKQTYCKLVKNYMQGLYKRIVKNIRQIGCKPTAPK